MKTLRDVLISAPECTPVAVLPADWARILDAAHGYLTSPATRAATMSKETQELIDTISLLQLHTVIRWPL